MRGYWDGQQLWTRGGERLQPPAWFTQGWPAQPMDGELWAGRGRFEHASGTVRQLKPDDLAWREIRFMVFDLPSHPGVFDARLQAYQTLVSQLNRSCLVKLKPFEDAEAKVLAHLLGQGKHSGRLGALVVETPAGLRFRLGGGFTDQQRESPPAVGRWITYRHHGQHSSGLPRFASFLRERPDFQPPEPGSAR